MIEQLAQDFVKSASEREHVLIRSDMDDNSDNGDDGFTIESKFVKQRYMSS